MKNTLKKSALAFAGLKSGQQILHDLDSIILNDSKLDVGRYAAENYICRFGSSLIAAYIVDKAVSYAEELALPKFLRGVFPILATTIIAGTAINYLGNYFNMQEGLGILESTKQLINNYQESLSKLAILDPETHTGYLAGAALTIKSGVRLCKNMGEAIIHCAEKKRVQTKQKHEDEINQLDKDNDED